MRKNTHKSQKCIDTYQQNHVYFVIIACKFIMVTLLIVTRVASQFYFSQNTLLFCNCPVCLQLILLVLYSYKALLLRIPAIESFVIEDSCNCSLMSHSVQ